MYLFGASGHGQVVLEIAEDRGHRVESFIDMDLDKKELLNIPIIHEIPKEIINVIIAIGNNTIRKSIVTRNKTFHYPTLVHSRANVSYRTDMGSGTVVMAGATINSKVNIGEHCIINTNASVDHDCILGNFVHVSPQAGLAGNVSVGEGTHIGIGAVVIQNIKIGKWVTIGAGAVIINNVPDFAVVVGNPGKIIKYRN